MANEKIRLLGDITRHDVLNFLTVLNENLQLLEMKNQDPTLSKYVNVMMGASKDIEKLLESSRNYQRLRSQEPERIKLNNAARSGISDVGTTDKEIHIDIPKEIDVYADPILDRAFSNLVFNVIKHAPAAKNIWIRTEHAKTGELEIIFEDDGPGTPEEMRDKIFDEKMGGRTGHGLHFVLRLLQVTGMCIRDAPESGKGARFVIQVPKCCVRTKRTNVVLKEK